MQFFLTDKQNLMGATAVDRAKSRSLSLLGKFSDHIRSIDLTVRDANGPRGGIDKICRVMIKLRGKADVVITAQEHKVSKAIAAAIERATRTVGRRVERRDSHGKRSLSRTGA